MYNVDIETLYLLEFTTSKANLKYREIHLMDVLLHKDQRLKVYSHQIKNIAVIGVSRGGGQGVLTPPFPGPPPFHL